MNHKTRCLKRGTSTKIENEQFNSLYKACCITGPLNKDGPVEV